jgi:hypothetical protein
MSKRSRDDFFSDETFCAPLEVDDEDKQSVSDIDTVLEDARWALQNAEEQLRHIGPLTQAYEKAARRLALLCCEDLWTSIMPVRLAMLDGRLVARVCSGGESEWWTCEAFDDLWLGVEHPHFIENVAEGEFEAIQPRYAEMARKYVSELRRMADEAEAAIEKTRVSDDGEALA